MSRFEHKCDRCGQGVYMFTLEGKCPICQCDKVTYVEKFKQYIIDTEFDRETILLGVKETLNN